MDNLSADPSTESCPVALTSEIDQLLSAQIIVAWAGESGEEKRLGWWKSDLVSEFGGKDLFQRLLPNTWQWAVLQAVREAARRTDARIRASDHDADRLVSLFAMGFEIDERGDERFQDLKRSGQLPQDALPGLSAMLDEPWSQQAFIDWVEGHGTANFTVAPAGRRLKGSVPTSLEVMVQRLVAALAPIADEYPLPHFRIDG